MKISELSEVELSRWIAEKNEARPVIDDALIARGHALEYEDIRSDLGWWQFYSIWTGKGFNNNWRSRSYDDPEIALRLLKDIVGKIDVTMLHRASVGGKSNYFVCPTIRGFLDIPDSLERAIAETWALQNGWQE